MENNNKTTPVYNTRGKFLSNCSLKRARDMTKRGKAKWLNQKSKSEGVILLISPKDEQLIRKNVLARDGYMCYICHDNIDKEDVTYDHIIPRSLGGEESEENLAVCCKRCNQHKADLTFQGYVDSLYASCYCLRFGL